MCWCFKKKYNERPETRDQRQKVCGLRSAVCGLYNNAGFILLEALVSIVIIAVSLTFILQSFTATYRAAALNADYTKALILLENQMSLVAQKGFIEAGLQQDTEYSEPFERFRYHLAATPSSSNVKGEINDVKLDITFTSGVKNNQISLITYLFKPADEKK